MMWVVDVCFFILFVFALAGCGATVLIDMLEDNRSWKKFKDRRDRTAQYWAEQSSIKEQPMTETTVGEYRPLTKKEQDKIDKRLDPTGKAMEKTLIRRRGK